MNLFETVTRLKTRVGAMTAYIEEPVDVTLESFIRDAAASLFPDVTIEALIPAATQAVILRAHILLCMRVASDAIHSFETSGAEGTAKPQQVVDSVMKLVPGIQKQLEEVLEDSLVSEKYQIRVIPTYRNDIYYGKVPENAMPITSADSPELSRVLTSDGTSFSWNACDRTDFKSYIVMVSETSGIYTAGSAYGNIPGASANARVFRRIYNRTTTAVTAQGLSFGTWYVVVAVELHNGTVAFSNEVSVSL